MLDRQRRPVLVVFLAALLLSSCSPGVDEERAAALTNVFRTAHEAGSFEGVALVELGGEVVWQEAFGMANRLEGKQNTLDTRFRIASISKSFTAYLALLLAEEGLLDLNEPLRTYLPAYDGPDTVTIHRLLSNTGGILHYEGLQSVGLSIQEFRPMKLTPDAFVDLIGRMPLACSPGSCFHYSSFGSNLVGAAIEAVTGMAYGDVLRTRVTQPLGMVDTGYFVSEEFLPGLAAGYEPDGQGSFEPALFRDVSNAYAAGGIVSSARDLLRWSRALQGDGPLDPELLLQMKTNQVGEIDPSVAYGYGVAVHQGKDSHPMGNVGLEMAYVIHGGSWDGFRSLLVSADQGAATIVILANSGGATDEMALGKAVASVLNAR